jgi:hypothetical protein
VSRSGGPAGRQLDDRWPVSVGGPNSRQADVPAVESRFGSPPESRLGTANVSVAPQRPAVHKIGPGRGVSARQKASSLEGLADAILIEERLHLVDRGNQRPGIGGEFQPASGHNRAERDSDAQRPSQRGQPPVFTFPTRWYIHGEQGISMKLRNYITRWQEFREWSETNRPEIVSDVESLGNELRHSIEAYRQASGPEERQDTMDSIKAYYDEVVEWHMREIIAKLDNV